MGSSSTFDQDIKDVHLIYDYDAVDEETKQHEKWRYEMWFFSEASYITCHTTKPSH